MARWSRGNLATAATVGDDYMIGIASRFAGMNGWTEAQIAALRTGTLPKLRGRPLNKAAGAMHS
jgi:hypothetical protein